MAEYMPDPWRLRAPFSASPTGALPPTPSRRSLSHADIVPFRERLRTARHCRGLMQSQLEAAAGLSPTWVSQMETGAREPSLGTLRKLAVALDCLTDYLVGITNFTSMDDIVALVRSLEERGDGRDEG